jgi:hypothetical protein
MLSMSNMVILLLLHPRRANQINERFCFMDFIHYFINLNWYEHLVIFTQSVLQTFVTVYFVRKMKDGLKILHQNLTDRSPLC